MNYIKWLSFMLAICLPFFMLFLFDAAQQRKSLCYAAWRNINLKESKYESAFCYRKDFDRIDFTRATLHNSELVDCSFRQSILIEVDLKSANLGGADFTDAKLNHVRARGATFVDAIFVNTDCSNGDFSRANLTQAKLFGCNFSNANLSNANLNRAVYDKTTQWPKGFEPQKNGAIFTNEPWVIPKRQTGVR